MSSKIVTMEEAVSTIRPGMNLSFSGFANAMCPVGFVRQMLRQGISDIEISAMGELWAADMLAGAGALRRIRQSCFLMEGFGRCRNFSRGAESGELAVEDYSHLGITSRFMAGAMGIPFLPIRSMMGSDIERISNYDGAEKLKVIDDPFTGEKIAVVKSLQPDVAIVHCSRADKNGNLQLFGLTSTTEQIAKSAKRVIATVEEIVEESEIRRSQQDTLIPGFFVDQVVKAPFGAHPAGMYRYYDFDKQHIALYARMAKDKETFDRYMDEYIYGTKNETEYLNKISLKRLLELRADPHFGISLKERGVL